MTDREMERIVKQWPILTVVRQRAVKRRIMDDYCHGRATRERTTRLFKCLQLSQL